MASSMAEEPCAHPAGVRGRRRPVVLASVWRKVQKLPQLHLLPDFVIIGAMRCGTTSLYRYLEQHPCVRVPRAKELHFFDLHFARGLNWYKRLFPTHLHRLRARLTEGHHLITGESSPYYLFHPHVPQRVFDAMPRARLIVLLRNPIDRAYSHYLYEIKYGRESLSFEAALDAEADRLQGELERMLADPAYYSFHHEHHAYLARGVYVDQIKAWRDFFSAEQMLVLISEELFRDPAGVYSRVLSFLDLPQHTLAGWDVHNARETMEPMSRAQRERLAEYYGPHNERLYQYLGGDCGW